MRSGEAMTPNASFPGAEFWLPKNTVFQLLLSRFLNVSNAYWRPHTVPKLQNHLPSSALPANVSHPDRQSRELEPARTGKRHGPLRSRVPHLQSNDCDRFTIFPSRTVMSG